MSNRNRLHKPKFMVAGSLAADLTSDWLNVEGVDNISIQLTWTGTPTGVLSVEASNDGPLTDTDTRQENPSLNVGASTIYTEATNNPAGSASNAIIPLTDRSETWIRVFYDRTSGTGAMSIGIAGKGI